MPYKLSERLKQNRPGGVAANRIDLGKLASVFIVTALISFMTAWLFSHESEHSFSGTIEPDIIPYQALNSDTSEQEENTTTATSFGPLTTKKYNETYAIRVAASLPVNTWSFVEGEVLDEEKEYLFSFGKELWHETGRDSDGPWTESENNYTMKITLPEPGTYYFRFKTQGRYDVAALRVVISKRYGSSLPHIMLGLFALTIGLVLNEIKNKTICQILEHA